MLTGFVIRNDSDENEFVWIPVKGMNYTYSRYAMLEKQSQAELDIDTQSIKIKYSPTVSFYFTEKMPEDEELSVAKYGGYYIGRYEAGVADYDVNDITTSNSSITDTELKENWTGYKAVGEKELKLIVQKNQQVWNYITRNKAETVSKGLYNKTENKVISKLCSSYAWDTALKFIETRNSTYLTNSIGGNYLVETGGKGKLQETGYHAINNIYDMGGNVWEWTTESYSNTDAPCVIRGGDYGVSSLASPAPNRNSNSTEFAYDDIAFRVTLFLAG